MFEATTFTVWPEFSSEPCPVGDVTHPTNRYPSRASKPEFASKETVCPVL